MHELQVTMLGPSGVGKTTLLTAMYDKFEDNIGSTDLQLTPDDDTSSILQDYLVDLKSLTNVYEAKGRVGIEGTEAVAGPESLRSFVFGLGKKGKNPSLQINFRDYPGKYHTAKASPEEKKFVKELLSQSAVVLIAIDAPALMEKNGKYHDEINRPEQIKDIFKDSYQELDSPRLVIFAPVKCEKYLKNEKTTQELLQRIKEGYKRLINYFETETLNRNIASVITPVQTVGSVVFSRLEVDDNNNIHFIFRKISHDAVYNPQDSEQPLRYLLQFLLAIHLKNRQDSFRIFKFLHNWLNLDNHLKTAVKEFAKGCKTSNGFEVIRGENLLKI